MGMIYGYARVSTDGQSVEAQVRQLTEAGLSAVRSGGCAGWSISIYNPDLDPDRSAARRIVEFVARIAPSAGG